MTNGASTFVVLLSDFAGDAFFYRLINVKYPQNFVKFCENFDIHLLPNPYQNMNCSNPELVKFEEYELSSCFLENAGDSLNKEAIALGVTALAWIFSWLLKNHSRLSKMFISIRTVLTWNTFINHFVSDFKEFILYCLLNLTQQSSDHRRLEESEEQDDNGEVCDELGSRFSYALSIIIIVSYLVMFGFFGYLLNRKKKKNHSSRSLSRNKILPVQGNPSIPPNEETNETEEEGKWMAVPRAFNSISSDLKNDTWFARNFILIYEFSGFLIVVCLVFLENHGTLQAGIYLGITGSLFILVLYFKPFETKFQTIHFAINYILRILMGMLAILIGEMPDQVSTEAHGLALIGLTLTTIAINTLVSVWVLFQVIRPLLMKLCWRKHNKSHNKTHPLPQNTTAIDVDFTSTMNKQKTRKNLTVETEHHPNFKVKRIEIKAEEFDTEGDRSNAIKDENQLVSRIENQSSADRVPIIHEFLRKKDSETYHTTKIGMRLKASSIMLNSPSNQKIASEDCTSPLGLTKIELDSFSGGLTPLKRISIPTLSNFRRFPQNNDCNLDMIEATPKTIAIEQTIKSSKQEDLDVEEFDTKTDRPEK